MNVVDMVNLSVEQIADEQRFIWHQFILHYSKEGVSTSKQNVLVFFGTTLYFHVVFVEGKFIQ